MLPIGVARTWPKNVCARSSVDGAENEEWNSAVTCSTDLVPNTKINFYASIMVFANKSATAVTEQVTVNYNRL